MTDWIQTSQLSIKNSLWRQFNAPIDYITATVDDHGFGGIAPHNTPYQHSIKVNITQVKVNSLFFVITLKPRVE